MGFTVFNGLSAFENSLAIRWFTPRGTAAVQAFLVDLAENEGRRSAEILASLRRRDVEEDHLDLRGMDFRGEALAGIRFPLADIRGANFVDCDLQLCDLSGARLEGARFVGAKLRGAKLSRASLQGADLRQADLREADLSNADLQEALLVGAQFGRCLLAGANLEGVDRRCADLSIALWHQPRAKVEPGPIVRPRPQSGCRPGRPPTTEPRRATTRRREPRPQPSRRARDQSAARARPQPGAQAPPAQADVFDQALTDLLTLRGSVERIVVVVDGVERVLLGKLQPLAPV